MSRDPGSLALPALTLLAAVLAGVVGCKRSYSYSRSSTTEDSKVTSNVGETVSTTGGVTTRSEVTTKTVGDRTEVEVVVDDHPKISRSFAFPVEVRAETTVVEGASRKQVIFRKKVDQAGARAGETLVGEVVEVIRL